jgi:hypothetical protein
MGYTRLIVVISIFASVPTKAGSPAFFEANPRLASVEIKEKLANPSAAGV